MPSCSSAGRRHTFARGWTLRFRVTGQSVEIFETEPRSRGPLEEKHESPVAKATYVRERGVRRVFWQRRDLKWHSYEPEPDLDSVEEFASLISEDVELSVRAW
jgi:hypothetical protein